MCQKDIITTLSFDNSAMCKYVFASNPVKKSQFYYKQSILQANLI